MNRGDTKPFTGSNNKCFAWQQSVATRYFKLVMEALKAELEELKGELKKVKEDKAEAERMCKHITFQHTL